MHRYNGKVHDHLAKVSSLLEGLSTKPILIIINSKPIPKDTFNAEYTTWDAFISEGQAAKLGKAENGEILWYRGGFNDPLCHRQR